MTYLYSTYNTKYDINEIVLDDHENRKRARGNMKMKDENCIKTKQQNSYVRGSKT